MSWINRKLNVSEMSDVKIITVRAKDGGIWTLVTNYGRDEDVMIKPTGVHVRIVEFGALADMANDMMEIVR